MIEGNEVRFSLPPDFTWLPALLHTPPASSPTIVLPPVQIPANAPAQALHPPSTPHTAPTVIPLQTQSDEKIPDNWEDEVDGWEDEVENSEDEIDNPSGKVDNWAHEVDNPDDKADNPEDEVNTWADHIVRSESPPVADLRPLGHLINVRGEFIGREVGWRIVELWGNGSPIQDITNLRVMANELREEFGGRYTLRVIQNHLQA